MVASSGEDVDGIEASRALALLSCDLRENTLRFGTEKSAGLERGKDGPFLQEDAQSSTGDSSRESFSHYDESGGAMVVALVFAGLSGCFVGYVLAGEFVEALLIVLMLGIGVGLGWAARGLLK